MTDAATHTFTHSHVVMKDGTVTFRCASDLVQWPWLALPPFDPIVVQSINYYASVETGAARGTFDPTKWSALTQTEWSCGEGQDGHATHGVASAISADETPRYKLTFFGADGSLIYHMSGAGVVFKTRDFEAWREKAKRKTPAPFDVATFQYAPAQAVGVGAQAESFLSHLIEGETPSAQALITKARGFVPGHPYHSGSGDHVNSNHIADASKQFMALLLGKKVSITGGEMRFTRYVELGRPFQIQLTPDGRSHAAISMIVRQADRDCAAVTMRYA